MLNFFGQRSNMNGILPLELSFIIALIFILTARIINAKAIKSLSQEKKAELVDKFAGHSAYSFIPLVLIFGFYFLLSKLTQIDPKALFYVTLIAILLFIVVNQILVSKKLKALKLDKNYRNRYLLTRVLAYIGIGILILTIIPAVG